MTIRLYFDEDSMQHALIEALRKRGVDVMSALDAGMTEQADQTQLEYAATHGRALYSFNICDFCRLHSLWITAEKSHAGIIVSRQQHFSVGGQMRRLLKLISSRSAEEMENQLEFLSTWG